jgi:hypothetical protein
MERGGAMLDGADRRALTVEQWPVARPYARNPRKNDAAIDKMCAAIREFGFRIPVVARSDGSVIDGHLRLKAAQRLGLDEVPVALADDLTEAQIKAFRLLANRSAAWAEWDDELLALELQDLKGLDYGLALTGFDAGELPRLMEDGPAMGLTDEDAVPEATKARILARRRYASQFFDRRLEQPTGNYRDLRSIERIQLGDLAAVEQLSQIDIGQLDLAAAAHPAPATLAVPPLALSVGHQPRSLAAPIRA